MFNIFIKSRRNIMKSKFKKVQILNSVRKLFIINVFFFSKSNSCYVTRII